MELSCVFRFAAAHYLTKYHGGCESLHGHNYKLIVTIEGPVKDDGMVLDYKILKKKVKEKVISKVDHTNLNDLLENPSSENIVIWIWEKLESELPLKKIRLYETEDYFCEYYGK